ncbi:MAG: biosynthetic peptidoglycan transglycosylase [Bacteriovoracaceae bacterium]
MGKLFAGILIILVFCSSICIGLVFYIVKSTDIDKLQTHYPYFDQTKGRYRLGPTKPPNWVAPHQVSKHARWAIIVSEDWAFYDHPGLDLNQLKLAIKESLAAQELTRGASTITQQVIKNTVLSDEKTLWRKLREAVLAFYLEDMLSKEKILEIYLNIIELGKDIYGIREASFYYFNKPPIELNAREGAFLAMLLPSPVKYSVSFYQKELTDFAKEQVESILVKLRQADVYSEEDRLEASQKKFYWEEDFYSAPESGGESAPAGYEDYLEDSYL